MFMVEGFGLRAVTEWVHIHTKSYKACLAGLGAPCATAGRLWCFAFGVSSSSATGLGSFVEECGSNRHTLANPRPTCRL